VKLKLDENMPQSAAPRFAALGYDADPCSTSGSAVEATKKYEPRLKPRAASFSLRGGATRAVFRVIVGI